ncbi:hypothetical protein D8674_020267 [Pyrus ussuriensis x Pyrus communis]|uniref:Uncharacterized protein n=1 Tax=Pyrus ussuriensis x Pyrus communis TaxID=2448454 RepID=A0A5N5HF65_9ROSA|nr:hypothetical protein D8674_020267 [Pyrus ussuriensis x Pyrus communis]
MAEKLRASFEQVMLEHIPNTTNRYVDALPILGSKLIFVEEQPNIAIFRRNAPKELSKPSRELNLKHLKEYINVTRTLLKCLSGGVLT